MASDPLITVVVDSREQKPWALNPNRFVTIREKLDTGDYSIENLRSRFCIERKSLGDVVGTVIGDWLRFRHELTRMMCFDVAAIVVEADIEDVLTKRYESDAAPSSVIGRLNAIYLDTGVPTFFWGKRTDCVLMVESFIALAAKKLGDRL